MPRRSRRHNLFELQLRRRYRQIYLDQASREKPYMCGICNERFKQHVLLDIHVRHHISKKPFACSLCSRRYCLRSSLHQHMLASHTVEAPNVPGKIDVSAGNLRQVLTKALGLDELSDKVGSLQSKSNEQCKSSTQQTGAQESDVSMIESGSVPVSEASEKIANSFLSEPDGPSASLDQLTETVKAGELNHSESVTLNSDAADCERKETSDGRVAEQQQHGSHKHKYLCHLCDEDLKFLKSFNEHMRTHLAAHGKLNRDVRRVYMCKKCGSTFHLLEASKAHKEICTQTGPEVVNDKEFIFKLGDDLIGSITCSRPLPTKKLEPARVADVTENGASGEQPVEDEFLADQSEIPCPVCETAFTSEELMLTHLNKHIEELQPVSASEDMETKAHLCSVCESAFDSFDEIASHVYDMHERDAFDDLLVKYLPIDPAAAIQRSRKKRKRVTPSAHDDGGVKRIKFDGSTPVKPCSVPIRKLDEDLEFMFVNHYDNDDGDDDYIPEDDFDTEFDTELPEIAPVRKASAARKSTSKVTPARRKLDASLSKTPKPVITSKKAGTPASKGNMSTPKLASGTNVRSKVAATSTLRSGKKLNSRSGALSQTKRVQNKENLARSRSVTPSLKKPDRKSITTRSGSVLHPAAQDRGQTPKSAIDSRGEHLDYDDMKSSEDSPMSASFANRGLRVVCTICNADLSLLTDAAAHMQSHDKDLSTSSSRKSGRGKRPAQKQHKEETDDDNYPSDKDSDVLPSISAVKKSRRLSRNRLTRVVAKQGIKDCSIILYRLTPGCQVTYGKITYIINEPQRVSSRKRPPLLVAIHARNRVKINGIMYKAPNNESFVPRKRSLSRDVKTPGKSSKTGREIPERPKRGTPAANKAADEPGSRAVHLICSKCRLVLFSREAMIKHMALHVEEELATAGDSSSDDDRSSSSDIEEMPAKPAPQKSGQKRLAPKMPAISMNMSTATAKNKANAGVASGRRGSAVTPKGNTPAGGGRTSVNGTVASPLINGTSTGRPSRLLRCARCKLELVSKVAMMKHMEDHVREDVSGSEEEDESSDGEVRSELDKARASGRDMKMAKTVVSSRKASTGSSVHNTKAVTETPSTATPGRIPLGQGGIRRVIMGPGGVRRVITGSNTGSSTKAKMTTGQSQPGTPVIQTPNLAKQLRRNSIISDANISADLSTTTVDVIQDESKSTNVIYVDHYVVDPNDPKHAAAKKTKQTTGILSSGRLSQTRSVSLVCGKCNATFTSEPSLIKHIEEHIREEVLSGSESGEADFSS